MIEGKEQYTILNGNLESPAVVPEKPELLGGHGDAGSAVAAAVPFCKDFRRRYPSVPIVWGGISIALHGRSVWVPRMWTTRCAVRAKRLLSNCSPAFEGRASFRRGRPLYKDRFGLQVHNPNRPLKSPDAFPRLPYHRLDASQYLLPTFLGSRTAVHQASIGCPFKCNFCGVVPVYDREKMEPAERTVSVLTHLKETYGANAVQFYDNNFFLREDHARELADRLEPLGMRWWCEARVDIVLGYSDDTLNACGAPVAR